MELLLNSRQHFGPCTGTGIPYGIEYLCLWLDANARSNDLEAVLQIPKFFIPDPDPGGKKAPDPGSYCTLKER
jgi:hypothetical protein